MQICHAIISTFSTSGGRQKMQSANPPRNQAGLSRRRMTAQAGAKKNPSYSPFSGIGRLFFIIYIFLFFSIISSIFLDCTLLSVSLFRRHNFLSGVFTYPNRRAKYVYFFASLLAFLVKFPNTNRTQKDQTTA